MRKYVLTSVEEIEVDLTIPTAPQGNPIVNPHTSSSHDHHEDGIEEKKAPEVFSDELEALLKTEPLQGLSDAEVQERLTTFGFNGNTTSPTYTHNIHFANIKCRNQGSEGKSFLKVLELFQWPYFLVN